MTTDSAWEKIVDRISDRQVLALEQAAIRIPSTTFEEGSLADHLANYMSDVGLDVEMMDVTHPAKPGKRTRQPIGRLRGSGGGPTLMLNGHMEKPIDFKGCMDLTRTIYEEIVEDAAKKVAPVTGDTLPTGR